jgi:RNA polymerase sigma-70 factor, ECF subfamily
MIFGPEKGHPRTQIELDTYLDGLYGYAVVLSRNSVEAEDLVQETCLRALRSAGQLRPNSNVKGWLFTILRNIWFNEVRRWRTTPDMVELDADGSDAIEPVDPARDPHAAYVSRVERERVREAIQQLPLEFREIILLREYEELSYQEIAAVLNCPPGTVMSRLARARSRLREFLQPEFLRPAQSSHPGKNDVANRDAAKEGGTAA